MALVREGHAQELIHMMKQPRKEQVLLEENAGLFYEKRHLVSYRKMPFFWHGKLRFGVDPSVSTALAASPSQALLPCPLQTSMSQQGGLRRQQKQTSCLFLTVEGPMVMELALWGAGFGLCCLHEPCRAVKSLCMANSLPWRLSAGRGSSPLGQISLFCPILE